jgi:formylglycine-generating enzyme required for sulfatase activity
LTLSLPGYQTLEEDLVVSPDRPKQRTFRLVAAAWPAKVTNSIGMILVRIPPGTFKIGSPEGEEHRSKDEKQHEVEISKDFWLGVYEVTQKQFKEVMGYNPSYFSTDGKGGPGLKYDYGKPGGGKDKVPEDTSDFPVENVTWEEAKEFCDKLSNRAEEKRSGRQYRLPTEAEWEYSCRGGAPSYQVFHFGNSLSSKQANFDGTRPYRAAREGPDQSRTCKVGSYEKNRFGLFDMHGNVYEWCSDWYAEDYGKSRRTDPSGPGEGVARVVRGGSWGGYGSLCRSAHRNSRRPSYRSSSLGFRVALVPAAKSSK